MMNDVRLIDANGLLKKKRRMYAPDEIDFIDPIATVCVTADDVNRSPTIHAVSVVRCRECKNGAPLPEEARAEFSTGVMRCLAGRGDCDRYCTTWEDGFCDEGAKVDGGAE